MSSLKLYFEIDFKCYKKLKLRETSEIFKNCCQVILLETSVEVYEIIPKIKLYVFNLQVMDELN